MNSQDIKVGQVVTIVDKQGDSFTIRVEYTHGRIIGISPDTCRKYYIRPKDIVLVELVADVDEETITLWSIFAEDLGLDDDKILQVFNVIYGDKYESARLYDGFIVAKPKETDYIGVDTEEGVLTIKRGDRTLEVPLVGRMSTPITPEIEEFSSEDCRASSGIPLDLR